MRQRSIGFDRHINLSWMDMVAGLAAANMKPLDVKKHLKDRLKDVLPSATPRSACGKAITVLVHIWSEVPEGAKDIRDRAILLLDNASVHERLALHWAMSIATYPFFAAVATAVGRLLELQGDVSLTGLTRRMTEVWGDRSTMPPAARKVVRSMVRWGALRDSARRGVYSPLADRVRVQNAYLELLVESLLVSGDRKALPVADIERHPALFPFHMVLTAQQLRCAKQFSVYQQGVNMPFVEIAKD